MLPVQQSFFPLSPPSSPQPGPSPTHAHPTQVTMASQAQLKKQQGTRDRFLFFGNSPKLLTGCRTSNNISELQKHVTNHCLQDWRHRAGIRGTQVSFQIACEASNSAASLWLSHRLFGDPAPWPFGVLVYPCPLKSSLLLVKSWAAQGIY